MYMYTYTYVYMANFIVSCLSKSLQDLFSYAWKMESSTTTLTRTATTGMEVMRMCATNDCVEG